MSKPILGYWKLRGLAQPIRYMLAYIGLDHEEKFYDLQEETLGKSWFEEKFTLGLDFPNVPYWIDGEIRMTEYRAILRYLAREKAAGKNLLPADPESQRKLDVLENAIYDIWQLLLKHIYGWLDENLQKFDETDSAKLTQLSKYLGSNKFLLGGNKPTYVDFMCYETLFIHTRLDGNLLKPFANLETYMENFEAIPEIAAFIKSPQHIATPVAAPFAKIPV